MSVSSIPAEGRLPSRRTITTIAVAVSIALVALVAIVIATRPSSPKNTAPALRMSGNVARGSRTKSSRCSGAIAFASSAARCTEATTRIVP